MADNIIIDVCDTMSLWSRHFTKLCKLVYSWERVSEIQSIKGTSSLLSQQLFGQRFYSSWLVNIASEVHCNASRSLTQPCLTAYCIRCNISMIQAFYQALQVSVSSGKCIWDPINQGLRNHKSDRAAKFLFLAINPRITSSFGILSRDSSLQQSRLTCGM